MVTGTNGLLPANLLVNGFAVNLFPVPASPLRTTLILIGEAIRKISKSIIMQRLMEPARITCLASQDEAVDPQFDVSQRAPEA